MSHIKRNRNIMWRHSGEDIMLFSTETGSLWRLNPTAAMAWEMFDGKHELADIVREILEKFPDVEEQRVRNGLERYLAELTSRRLIYI